MANLSITAASVFPGSNAVKEYGVFGEAVTAGQLVYKKAADGKYWLSDSNSATAEVRGVSGVALVGGAANQQAVVQTGGNILPGATVVVGETYYLGETPGAIQPRADVGSGEYVTKVGFGISTTTIKLGIESSGVAVP